MNSKIFLLTMLLTTSSLFTMHKRGQSSEMPQSQEKKVHSNASQNEVPREDDSEDFEIIIASGIKCAAISGLSSVPHNNHSGTEVIPLSEYISRDEEFIDAAARNQLERCSHLLQEGVIDCNSRNKGGWTALTAASYFGNKEIVQLLLAQQGIDVNVANEEGGTPLLAAVITGHKAIVQLLINHPTIDINQQAKDGSTALILAAQKGDIEIAQLLLQKPAISIGTQSQTGWTALMLAAYNNHEEIVELLIEASERPLRRIVRMVGSSLIMHCKQIIKQY